MLRHLLVFALAFVGVLLFLSPSERRLATLERLRGTRSEPEPEPGGSFKERVLLPFLRDVGGFLTRISPSGWRARTLRRLSLAGRPWSLEVHYLLKAVLSLLSLTLILAGTRWLGATLVLLILANRLPDFVLERKATQRRYRFLRLFPDVLDLLAISVEAGLGFDGAMDQVSRRFPEPVAGEFALTLAEIRLGKPRSQALRGLAERLDLSELTAFVTAMNQAEELGVGVTEVLRTQAESLRTHRAQAVQERVMKVPIKMLFPLVFFILPALFVVLLGPIALSLKGTLFP